jgi:hypothetical protein
LLTVSSAFTSFVSSYGLDPSTTGAANADPDGDGVPNSLEFVLGGNPTVADNAIQPLALYVTAPDGPVLVYQFDRQTAANAALSSWVEYSSDLTDWTVAVDGRNGVTVSLAPLTAALEQVTVTIPAPGSRLFARLRASEL